MTRLETLILVAKTVAHTILALPIDKPTIADLTDPFIRSLTELPWAACYLLAAVVAKTRHSEMHLVYGLIFLKALFATH